MADRVFLHRSIDDVSLGGVKEGREVADAFLGLFVDLDGCLGFLPEIQGSFPSWGGRGNT
jgi:hypothetical protein